MLSFSAYQSFKLAYDYPGGYKVTKSDGAAVVDYTSFDFASFQRVTSIVAEISTGKCIESGQSCVLEVYNKIRDKTSVDFTCHS